MTTVSVVIPTHNRRELLGLTLRSALGQRDVDKEIIVVDDGSVDDTTASVAATPGVRVLRHEEPQGVSAARNTGIAAATGDWVALLDDDDLWGPDKLTRQLAAARRSGCGWVYAGDVSIDGDLRVLGGRPPPSPRQVVRDLQRHNAVPAGASNVLIRRDVLARAGGFDRGLSNNEDWDMWIRLARQGPPDCVARPLVAYRVHPGNASRDMPRMLRELDVIAARHGIPVDRPAHHRWAAWSYLADGRRGDALVQYARAVAAGDLPSVARAAVVAVHPAPTRLRRPRASRSQSGPWVVEAQEWLDTLTGHDGSGRQAHGDGERWRYGS